jgi:hypothetical protein
MRASATLAFPDQSALPLGIALAGHCFHNAGGPGRRDYSSREIWDPPKWHLELRHSRLPEYPNPGLACPAERLRDGGMMVMGTDVSGGTPASGPGKMRQGLKTAFGTWLPRLSKREQAEYAQWHLRELKDSLPGAGTGGSASGGSPLMEDIRWHAAAAAEALEPVVTAAWKRTWTDLGAIIALIGLGVSLAVFIGNSVSTDADNGGLRERVNALTDQVTTLQRQLTGVSDSYNQITKLVNDQLERGSISVQTVLRYVPGGKGLCSCGQVLVITSPARPAANNPAAVPRAITVTGTINKQLDKTQSIWILVSTPGINRYYPQGSAPDGVGPAILDANHQWTSPTVLLGGPGDKGRIFYVIAVLADANATTAFWNYLKTGASTHKFPGLGSLPQGAIEYDRVEVIRS